MKVTITDILALWGAVVSTIVAIWSITRDFVQRDRLVVTASIMCTHPGDIDILAWRFTNIGRHELEVTHLAAMPHRMLRPRWLFRFINRRRNSHQSLFGFEFLGGRLPLRVPPLMNATAQYILTRLGAFELGELYAVTADGREWFVKKADIERILENEAFQSLQAQPAPEDD